jgi:hypothetical protein
MHAGHGAEHRARHALVEAAHEPALDERADGRLHRRHDRDEERDAEPEHELGGEEHERKPHGRPPRLAVQHAQALARCLAREMLELVDGQVQRPRHVETAPRERADDAAAPRERGKGTHDACRRARHRRKGAAR